MLKYGFNTGVTNPYKVIDRDLKVCPWLKVFNYLEKSAEVIYIDEIHGDLWRRCITNANFILKYDGRLVRYNELIKEDKEDAQET